MINQEILKWTECFLTDRKQKVVINGEESSWTDVLSGVLQGSVIGPPLFVIYILRVLIFSTLCGEKRTLQLRRFNDL